jgi:mRNA interferase RelE/StbE
MPIRVQFTADARDDLRRYAQSGNIRLFLQKLVRLEEVGKAAGQPLGRGLAGYYKIVVGDRDWRIIFTLDRAETVATVVVIGDRADAACYEEAQKRLAALDPQSPEIASLAAAMLELPQLQKKPRPK